MYTFNINHLLTILYYQYNYLSLKNTQFKTAFFSDLIGSLKCKYRHKTQDTIHFTNSYQTFMESMMRTYSLKHHHLIMSACVDILMSHDKRFMKDV